MKCLSNISCPSGYCKKGVCENKPRWTDPCKPGYCSSPYVCDDFTSRCRRDPEFPPSRDDGCLSNVECPRNWFCKNNSCVPAKAAGQKCSWTDDCEDGMECSSGLCVVRCFEDSDCGF